MLCFTADPLHHGSASFGVEEEKAGSALRCVFLLYVSSSAPLVHMHIYSGSTVCVCICMDMCVRVCEKVVTVM